MRQEAQHLLCLLQQWSSAVAACTHRYDVQLLLVSPLPPRCCSATPYKPSRPARDTLAAICFTATAVVDNSSANLPLDSATRRQRQHMHLQIEREA